MDDLPIVFTREELERHDQRIIEALAKEADIERDRSDSVLRMIEGIDIPAHRAHWRRVGNWLRNRPAALAAPVEPTPQPERTHYMGDGCDPPHSTTSAGPSTWTAPPVEQP